MDWRTNLFELQAILLSASLVKNITSDMASSEENAFDDELQSDSLINVRTPSPSILNSPKEDTNDSDGEDDGVNVTIRPLRPPPLMVEKSDGTATSSGKASKSGDSDKADKVKRRTMCGAARRRLQRLMKDGLDYAAAREQALLPQASTPKRSRQSDLDRTNSSEGKPVPKKICDNRGSGSEIGSASSSRQVNMDVVIDSNESKVPRNVETKNRVPNGPEQSRYPKFVHGSGREALPAPTYSDIANRVRLGIMPRNYPVIELTTNQQEVVQEALLLKVVQQRREHFKPKFVCCRLRPGYLVLTCQGKETADWVKNKFTSLVLWEGADLVVVDEDKIPRPEVLIAFFPWSAKYGNDMIMSLLESQNDDLFADTWRILYRRVKGEHVELTFTVDDCSLRKFKDRKFVLNFRYGQIQITKQRPVQSAKKEEVPTIPNAVPDEMAMDCEVVHEDPIVPGTSAVGNRSFANSKNITLSSEKEEGLTGANNDLDDQGQHNAHGNHKSGADDSGSQGQYNTHGLKKSKARKPCGSNPISSIQNRLQRRE